MPIAFHPEPASDHDVEGQRTGGDGAAEHSSSAGGPEDTSPARSSRDALTERILARGDASVSAVTYGSEADGDQYDLADRQALRRVAGPSDMPGIPHRLAEHSLNILKGIKPVKPALRRFSEPK